MKPQKLYTYGVFSFDFFFFCFTTWLANKDACLSKAPGYKYKSWRLNILLMNQCVTSYLLATLTEVYSRYLLDSYSIFFTIIYKVIGTHWDIFLK